jgi:hypothetical protein
MAKATLACRALRETAPSGGDTPAIAAVEPEPEASGLDDFVPNDAVAEDLPVTTDVAGNAQVGSAAAPALRPVADVGNPGFAYPIVFAIPLIVLIVGGYLGFALTRPVTIDERS